MHITGSDLSPLVNFRQSGAEGDDENLLATPGTGLPTELPTSATLAGSRKRQRQDETADPEAGPSVTNHASQASLQNGDESISASHDGRRASGQQPAHPLQVTGDHRRESQSYVDEAHHFEHMTRDHTSPESIAAMNAERFQQTGQLVYHPSTSRIRATGRPIPPEEMFSTDEDDPSALADNEATATQRTDRTGGNTSQESASRHFRSIDDNAPRSPPPSSQPGYVNESSNTVGTPGGGASSSMKRTGSASSAPAALGPTTAKISSSNASELRPDKKGNLRYLGSASTSAVVAELADRQRWDVESPGLHSAAAAARRRSRAMPPPNAGTAGFNGHGQNGDAASSNSSSLTMVEEGDDNDLVDSQRTTDPQQVSQKQHFARPPMRPKPWEIFSNLGVTVAGALPSVEEIALPPEDLARKLVDNFFEYLHPL